MPHAAEPSIAEPAILSEVKPASLPRAEIVGHGRSFSWITEKICGIAEERTPAWWWWCFGVASLLGETIRPPPGLPTASQSSLTMLPRTIV